MEVSSNASILQASPGVSAVSDAVDLVYEEDCFTGVSAYIAQLKDLVSEQAAQTGLLLLVGERGLRHARIARSIHKASGRALDAFHQVSPRTHSVESLRELLFAVNGLLVADTASTIFLDDLAATPPSLLRRYALLLEEQRWQAGRARARLICAAFEEADAAGLQEEFAHCSDKTLRPCAFRLRPLRERSEDIPCLVKLFASRLARRLDRGEVIILPTTLELLTAYDWRENLDELEAVLESVIRHIPPTTINENLLPHRVRFAGFHRIPEEGFSLHEAVKQFENSLIATALQQAGGLQARAAQLLGLSPQTLHMKLKRVGAQQANGAY